MAYRGLYCKRNADAVPHPHACSVWHETLVASFYEAREAQNLRAEAATMGYATELDEYFRDIEPKITFRYWLEQNRAEEDPAA